MTGSLPADLSALADRAAALVRGGPPGTGSPSYLQPAKADGFGYLELSMETNNVSLGK